MANDNGYILIPGGAARKPTSYRNVNFLRKPSNPIPEKKEDLQPPSGDSTGSRDKTFIARKHVTGVRASYISLDTSLHDNLKSFQTIILFSTVGYKNTFFFFFSLTVTTLWYEETVAPQEPRHSVGYCNYNDHFKSIYDFFFLFFFISIIISAGLVLRWLDRILFVFLLLKEFLLKSYLSRVRGCYHHQPGSQCWPAM